MSLSGRCLVPVLAAGVVAVLSCSGSGGPEAPAQPEAGQRRQAKTPISPDEAEKRLKEAARERLPQPLGMTSPVMEHHGTIPARFTCDGEGLSPELNWANPPSDAKSFALIVEDPDAVEGRSKSFVHWVVYNIPLDVLTLPEGVPAGDTLQNGAKQGKNDFGAVGWGAPCPPPGGPAKGHRYLFRLYALDEMLDIPAGLDRIEAEKAMKGHVVAQTGILATYARKAN